MQGEERYMTLNVELKKRNSIQTSQLKCQGGHVDCFPILASGNNAMVNTRVQTALQDTDFSSDCSAVLHRYKIFLGLSGTVSGILALTLITLTLLVSQEVLLRCQKGNNSNFTQHDDIRNLKAKSDARGNISNKDAGRCVSGATNNKAMCPSEWLKYQEKCYWFSNEMKSWNDSYGYCLGRKSHLLIIQDQLEMAFIQKTLKQSNYVWIGLNFTSLKKTWTWVDDSPLDPKIFFIKGPAEENSCAALKENRIYSETCSSVFKWICQY
ncbi:killer cell lectin-like receptor subfamily F member 1 isoform X1 [Camelus dromedarius]|uniref:Killer cell lectin-like receptor subfamily F member 1 isoform X2 n=2 Tax=Camelus TaxID=9836 RepID=A0A8B8SGU8_CAMFR|nr:killer cell lectin-like receptor subfamily F member 1 isoform X2 [Camelus ferus]XP_045366174.1 killer cell lectin-like receptor subfamily F member 1 isoform X1 [Camelus bactrianus]